MTDAHGIDFALVLNPHQPAGYLDELLDVRPWEAKWVIVDRTACTSVLSRR